MAKKNVAELTCSDCGTLNWRHDSFCQTCDPRNWCDHCEQKGDAYVALNPMASLPALKDGDFVLWESNAILQYAADKYRKTEFYPTDLQRRADINRWLLRVLA